MQIALLGLNKLDKEGVSVNMCSGVQGQAEWWDW